MTLRATGAAKADTIQSYLYDCESPITYQLAGVFCYNKSSKSPFSIFSFSACRIAVFSINVLKDERIIIVAEQRPDCAEEDVSSTLHSCLVSNISPQLVLTFNLRERALLESILKTRIFPVTFLF